MNQPLTETLSAIRLSIAVCANAAQTSTEPRERAARVEIDKAYCALLAAHWLLTGQSLTPAESAFVREPQD